MFEALIISLTLESGHSVKVYPSLSHLILLQQVTPAAQNLGSGSSLQLTKRSSSGIKNNLNIWDLHLFPLVFANRAPNIICCFCCRNHGRLFTRTPRFKERHNLCLSFTFCAIEIVIYFNV